MSGAAWVEALPRPFWLDSPLAPAGLPLVAIGCLVVQQLVADSAATVYDITEVSVRQTLVRDRRPGQHLVPADRIADPRPYGGGQLVIKFVEATMGLHEQVQGGLLGALVIHPRRADADVLDRVAIIHRYDDGPSLNGGISR